MSSYFSSETMYARKEQSEIFSVEEKKKITNLENCIQKNYTSKRRNKDFSDKQIYSCCVAVVDSRPALHEC